LEWATTSNVTEAGEGEDMIVLRDIVTRIRNDVAKEAVENIMIIPQMMKTGGKSERSEHLYVLDTCGISIPLHLDLPDSVAFYVCVGEES
jgi:hypothetical protein